MYHPPKKSTQPVTTWDWPANKPPPAPADDIHEWIQKQWQPDYGLQLLELGAHYCEDTEVVLAKFLNAKADCWECDPRCVAEIRRKDIQRVLLMPWAVGAKQGVQKFWQSDGGYANKPEIPHWDFSGSLRRPMEHTVVYPTVTFESQIQVHVWPLDQWYSNKRFDFVWVDIQGGERDMIEGGKETLQHCNFVYMETEQVRYYEGMALEKELTQMMKDLGFEVVRSFGNNTLYKNPWFMTELP
jgi:FkbM family methyltransferase